MEPPSPTELVPVSGSRAKTKQTLFLEIEALGKEVGVEKLVFVTMTFGDHVVSLDMAQRRWKRLRSDFLPLVFRKAVVVFERSSNSRIHLHAVAIPQVLADFREGFDWAKDDEMKRAGRAGDRRAMRLAGFAVARSASPELRRLWRAVQRGGTRHGFGRTEVRPVRKGLVEVARYLAAYLSKDSVRRPEDVGRRLIRFIGYTRKESGVRRSLRTVRVNSWGWQTPGASYARWKMQAGARVYGVGTPELAKKALGPRWAWWCMEAASKIPREEVPEIHRERWDADCQKLVASQALLGVSPRQKKIFEKWVLHRPGDSENNSSA